jgi:FkbM family methyltransferase
MEPILYSPERTFVAAVKRLITATFVERRLPHRVSLWLDRRQINRGNTLKTLRLRGLRLTVRRGTSDFHMACEVLAGEYFRTGYNIDASDTIIDIGGNIGAFALAASKKAPLGRVFTFEPSADSYGLLIQNVNQNGIKNVVATHAAVAGMDGTLMLHVDSNHTGRTSIDVAHAGNGAVQEAVPALSLRSILDKHRIDRCDLLKLDCEGAEYDILYSLPHEHHRRIRRIAMEYHGGYSLGTRQAKARELVTFLEHSGYAVTLWIDNVCSDCGWIFATRRSDDPLNQRA